MSGRAGARSTADGRSRSVRTVVWAALLLLAAVVPGAAGLGAVGGWPGGGGVEADVVGWDDAAQRPATRHGTARARLRTRIGREVRRRRVPRRPPEPVRRWGRPPPAAPPPLVRLLGPLRRRGPPR